MGKNRFVSTIVLLVGVGVTAALIIFNRSTVSYDRYIVGNLIALFLVPMITILFLFREDPAKFGLCAGGSWSVWLPVVGMYAVMVVVMVAAAGRPEFQAYYPLFRRYPEFSGWFALNPDKNPFTNAPMLMLYAEASYGLYMLCWEFCFRGYMLFGLFRSIGWPAVIVQAAAFGLLHLGKPIPEQIASYGAGIVLGVIALNARSIAPCFALHWAVALTFDLIVVANRPVFD